MKNDTTIIHPYSLHFYRFHAHQLSTFAQIYVCPNHSLNASNTLHFKPIETYSPIIFTNHLLDILCNLLCLLFGSFYCSYLLNLSDSGVQVYQWNLNLSLSMKMKWNSIDDLPLFKHPSDTRNSTPNPYITMILKKCVFTEFSVCDPSSFQ